MTNNLRDIADMDRVIHEPARLMLVTLLYAVDGADFLYLLRESGLTKGNLSTHLTRLEQAADPLREGIAIAGETVRWARELCQGVHLMTLGHEDRIPEILA